MKILITGASGFVGRHIVSKLLEFNMSVTALVRSPSGLLSSRVKQVVVPEFSSLTGTELSFDEYDVFIHSAAVSSSRNSKRSSEISEINTDLTKKLARICARHGIKRFIFISSIKVFGESSRKGKPFTLLDPLNPSDPYAISKRDAEVELKKELQGTDTRYVIVRPPLVYGAGVNGNFKTLLRIASINIPLPFGGLNNLRSMIYVENLVDLIISVIDHPEARNQTFLVSDGVDLSTSQLLNQIRISMNNSKALFKVPTTIFYLVGMLLNKMGVVDRIAGSLQVDMSYTCAKLNWRPPYSIEEALKATALDYLTE